MKNFQGLHKCATGAVINTEDFMKSNQSNTGSMLEGTASLGDRGSRKRKRDMEKRQRQRDRQMSSRPSKSCRNNYIGN